MAFSFDPLSLISGIAQAQANAQAAAIEEENLQFQKQQAQREYDLATSTRTDAYGNEQSYDPILKRWVTKLTPTQEALVRAGEHEQQQSLTTDAARNRQVRTRQEARAEQAVPDYERALTGFRYDQPASEGADYAELARLMAGAQQDQAGVTQEGLGREAFRLGKGSSIPQIVKESQDLVGQSLPSTLLAARSQARGEHMQDVQAHDARYIPELEHFATTEDNVGQAPIDFSGTPGALSGQQSEMTSQIAQALAQGGSGVGNAYGTLAQAITGSAPNFGSMPISFGADTTAAKNPYLTVPPGNSIFDPTTGQVVYTAPVYGKGTGTVAAGSGSSSAYDDALAAVSRLASGDTGL